MASKAAEIFEKFNLVKDLGLAIPSGFAEASLTFPGDLKINPGDKITPTQNKEKPSISWEAHQFVYYTLLMTDADVSLGGEKMEIKHWLVTNIPGNQVEKGHEAAEFMPAAPSRESGAHRYAFLIYRQKVKQPEEPKATRFELYGRAPFKAAEYAAEKGLIGPIAGNFFQAEYDDSVPEMHRNFLKFPYIFSNVYNLAWFKVAQWFK